MGGGCLGGSAEGGRRTVHTKGMPFQFVTTKIASRIRLVRPGPVTKFCTIVFQSTCASDRPAAATMPVPAMGSKWARAFADAMLGGG